MFYDATIELNVLTQGETINNENGVTIKNKLKCTEEVVTLSVLPINLSHNFEINITPNVSQIYQSKVKTITRNFVPIKKDGLLVKDDQGTVTISYSSPFVGLPFSPVHLQSRLEDQPIPGWPCGVGRYFQATLLNVLRIPRSVLGVLGAGQLLDALRR
ncbi:hypothetical protein TNCV_2812881 [Trichonephila clavipes]|nr:hypothetical protein TNCV_2812881 [Trichonephila clavipes]